MDPEINCRKMIKIALRGHADTGGWGGQDYTSVYISCPLNCPFVEYKEDKRTIQEICMSQ